MTLIQITYDELPGIYRSDKKNYGIYRGEDCVLTAALRTPGEKSLCVAIIEQAVMDYFILVRRGAIKQGKLTGKCGEKRQDKLSKKTGEQYMTHTIEGMTANDMRQLINFLQFDIARLSNACNFDISTQGMFERILELERTGNYPGSQERRSRETYATINANRRRSKMNAAGSIA